MILNQILFIAIDRQKYLKNSLDPYWSGEWTPIIPLEYTFERPPYVSAHYRVRNPIHFRALQSERPPYSLLLCVHHCNARWFAQLLCALQHLRQMVHRCCRAPNLTKVRRAEQNQLLCTRAQKLRFALLMRNAQKWPLFLIIFKSRPCTDKF